MGDQSDPFVGLVVVVMLVVVAFRLLRFAFVWFVLGVVAIAGGAWIVGILLLAIGEFMRASSRAG